MKGKHYGKVRRLLIVALLCFSGCASIEKQALERLEEADLDKIGSVLRVEEWPQARRDAVAAKCEEAALRLRGQQ